MTQRIVVTGATGFLGRHAVPHLVAHYQDRAEVVGLSSQDYDLTRWEDAARMMKDQRPDVLVHLAAYVGGIGANAAWPADFYYRNTLLVAQVFRAAAEFGVKKLIYTMGGCSYPAAATSPIDEAQMWDGLPQAESAPYSTAKKMGIIAADAYASQCGLRTVILVPGNMYGPHDNFRPKESHVIPAMIKRYVDATINNASEVVMWGSGRATRDFVHVADVAATFPFFIDKFDSAGPVNISSGISTSIKELAELVKDVVGYRGRITWDPTKPDGQAVKIFDVSRLSALGLQCPTPLREGVASTAAWFRQHYGAGTDNIRV
jgi:GDP-L-fucose synthase